MYIFRLSFYFDIHVFAGIRNISKKLVLLSQLVNKGPKPDPLNNPLNGNFVFVSLPAGLCFTFPPTKATSSPIFWELSATRVKASLVFPIK